MEKDWVLKKEEEKALKVFLLMFYSVYFIYDGYYYFFYFNMIGEPTGLPEAGMEYWTYVYFILLLPLAVLLQKCSQVHIIKYIYVVTFICVDIVNNLMIYSHEDVPFASGNAVEIVIILLTPIFVNKRYFWYTSCCLILKYIILGILLHAPQVIIPIILLCMFSAIAFIILMRFHYYIHTIEMFFEEIRQVEKFAVIGRMASTIAHEIRNPLTALKGFTQLQQEKHVDDRENYYKITQELDAINHIVTELMTLGKPQGDSYKKTNIMEIVSHAVETKQQKALEQGITIRQKYSDDVLEVCCDQIQLKQAIMNVLQNAVESMTTGGYIDISVQWIKKKKVSIQILDQGCGMKREEIVKLGEAFYTTKEKGTGLGLMITYKIIEEHQGDIKIESNVGIGTKVEIILPII